MPEALPPQPGIKLVFKTPEQENLILERTSRFSDWMRQRTARKHEIKEQILQYPDAPIDAERLSKTPDLFTFNHGFEGHPPPEYNPGEEPAIAPLSREQMRILLAESIPAPMLAFVLDHFAFNFEPLPEDHQGPPPGPIVKIDKNNKVDVTFFQHNFYTKGVPTYLQNSKDPSDHLRAQHTAAFLDPSKIAMFMGKIVAKMIEPPENWHEMVSRKWEATREKRKVDKKKFAQLPKEAQEQIKTQKQWEDFAALAVASPDYAKDQFPEAYRYFLEQTEKFSDVTHDKAALQALAKHGADGVFQMHDFNVSIDVRSKEQKEEQKGLSPQLAWYEKFVTFLNRGASKFGFIFTYEKPEDPLRAALLAEDDKEIKRLLELGDEKDRDFQFGEIMSRTGNEFHKGDRNETRRLLVAMSQAGEFSEWRIWAWLQKFSDTFRRTSGRHISEDDYKDLQIIYSQSAKVGNRPGTEVIPYDNIRLTTQTYQDSHLLGRKGGVAIPTRTDYKVFAEKVRKKVMAKSDRALMDANESVYSRFKAPDGSYLPLSRQFDATPEGMMTTSGYLPNLVGDKFAMELSSWMGRAGIDQVSPDAEAVANRMLRYYRSLGSRTDKSMKPTAIEIITHYGSQLAAPPEEEIKELTSISAKEVAKSEDFRYIGDRIRAAGTAQNTANAAIASRLKDVPLLDYTKVELMKFTREHPTAAIHPTALLENGYDIIDSKLRPGSLENKQEKSNLLRALQDPNVQRSYNLLSTAVEYQQALYPRYFVALRRTAADVAQQPELLLGSNDKIYEDPENERFAILERHKIIDRGELKRINETKAPEPAEGETPDEAAAIIRAEQQTKQNLANTKTYVKEKIAGANKDALEAATMDYVGNAIKELDGFLTNAGLGDSYAKRYGQWRQSAGRILDATELKRTLDKDLQVAVNMADQKGPAQRVGLDGIYNTVREVNKSLEVEHYLLDPKSPAFIEEKKEEGEEK